MDNSTPSEARPLSILLVDDDPIVQISHSFMLKKHDCNVTTANNGQETLAKIEQDDFDIVFIDIGLPDIDGLAVTKAIRARDDHKSNLTIVAITGNTSPELQEDCYRAGINTYLIKPVHEQDILACLTDLPTSTNHE